MSTQPIVAVSDDFLDNHLECDLLYDDSLLSALPEDQRFGVYRTGMLYLLRDEQALQQAQRIDNRLRSRTGNKGVWLLVPLNPWKLCSVVGTVPLARSDVLVFPNNLEDGFLANIHTDGSNGELISQKIAAIVDDVWAYRSRKVEIGDDDMTERLGVRLNQDMCGLARTLVDSERKRRAINRNSARSSMSLP